MRLMALIPLLFPAVLLAACNKKSCVPRPLPSNCIFDFNTCTCTWSDGGLPNPPDAPANSNDVRVIDPLCGNGVLDPGEQCDDGVSPLRKTGPGAIDDGCNALCQIEAGWQCPTPGQACIHCGTDMTNLPAGCHVEPLPYCGDGIVQANREECDLGNLNGVCLDEQSGAPPDAGQGNAGDAGCPLGSWDWDGTQVCNCPEGSRVFCTTTCQYPYVLP